MVGVSCVSCVTTIGPMVVVEMLGTRSLSAEMPFCAVLSVAVAGAAVTIGAAAF